MEGNSSKSRWIFGATGGVGVIALVVLAGSMSSELRILRPMRHEVKVLRALPMIGDYVPKLRMATLRGDSITLGETVQGRSQLVFAISAGCAICREMLPDMQKIADSAAKSGKHDVIFASISPRDSTEAYVAQHHITQPVILLEDVRTTRLYPIKGVPMILVLDRLGRVRYAYGSLFRTQTARDSIFAMTEEATSDQIRRPVADSTAKVAAK